MVAGSSGQLGSALVEFLVERDHQVAGLDIRAGMTDGLERFHKVDFRNSSALTKTVQDAASSLGGVDCLVNLAASRPRGYFAESATYNMSTWEEVLNVNLTAQLVTSQAAFSYLRRSSCASILNFSSIYGIRAQRPYLYGDDAIHEATGEKFNTPVSYSVSKTATVGLTRHLAVEWAPFGIRVNAIAPGGVKKDQSQEFQERYSSMTPSGRMATSDEVIEAAYFLTSPNSRYITGVTLPVDGGWSL